MIMDLVTSMSQQALTTYLDTKFRTTLDTTIGTVITYLIPVMARPQVGVLFKQFPDDEACQQELAWRMANVFVFHRWTGSATGNKMKPWKNSHNGQPAVVDGESEEVTAYPQHNQYERRADSRNRNPVTEICKESRLMEQPKRKYDSRYHEDFPSGTEAESTSICTETEFETLSYFKLDTFSEQTTSHSCLHDEMTTSP